MKNRMVLDVAKITGVDPDVSDQVIKTYLDLMALSLVVEGELTIRRFGRFQTYERPPVRLRNPHSAAPIFVGVRRTVVFHPTPELKRRMNGG